MRTLKFRGWSDDTFGEETTGIDHDNVANGKPIVFTVRGPDGEGLNVWGEYAGRDWPSAAPGCWMIGVQQVDEDVPLPGWPLRFTAAGYSPTLEIDAPDASTVSLLP